MPKPKPKPLGDRIRRLRQEKGLSLNDLANETGRAVEYLEKIEANEIFPTVAMLLQLARALHVESGTFFKNDETLDQRIEAQAKRTAHYSYKTLTPHTADKHLKAFLITVPPRSVHDSVEFRHEGEEFEYVLKGEIIVTVGENENRLKIGEAIHFNATIPHHVTNPTDEESVFVAVLYTP